MNSAEDKTILLVEDDPNDGLLTVRALKKNGVEGRVVVARDGVEALDYLFAEGSYAGRDATATPRIVLLDLRLPKLDGLEVLGRLRSDERTTTIPVVVFISSDEDRDAIENSGLQASGYIRKPVGFEQFVEAVRQLEL
jgi:two-component system, response regulator